MEPGGLADALFTRTQQRVLGHLFGEPSRSFTVSELIAATGAGTGAVQREVAKLHKFGLVTLQPVGNQKRYQANPQAPIYDELVGILRKTCALVEPLREVLAPLRGQIEVAFVYGSVAKGMDRAASDIDLLILSEVLGYADVVLALHPLQERLQRDINPSLYTREEWQRRAGETGGFVSRLMDQPKLWVIGGMDDLTVGKP
jgi:predicted nucleotidyltransferase